MNYVYILLQNLVTTIASGKNGFPEGNQGAKRGKININF
jgi:hypothetical protein